MNYIRVFSLLFVFVFLFSSCKKQQNGNDSLNRKDRISEKNMIEMLFEIHLLEESTQRLHLKKNEKKQFASYYYQQLFEKYNTDKELFIKNLKYYQKDLENFDKMYEKIVAKLSNLQEIKNNEEVKKE